MTLTLVQTAKTAKLHQRRPPRRPTNASVRTREYLTADEVKRLREAARRTGRNGFRDALLIDIAFRHGLRVGELVQLTWQQVHFADATIYVTRLKNGKPSTHFLAGDTLRQLRRLQREQAASRFLFCSERGGPITARTVRHIVKRAGTIAGLTFPVHPHMLRHARGYVLAQRGIDTRLVQGFLGHSAISSTVRYTELDPNRYKGLESD